MKHNLKITAVLLGMFLITQAIGLAVLYADPLTVESTQGEEVSNPYLEWITIPEAETGGEFAGLFAQLLIAFFIAISLLIFLMKFKIEVFLKIWFFLVIVIALFISFLAFEKLVPWVIDLTTGVVIALVLAIVLAGIKIFGRNILVHNLTELLIYPGIAVIFVPILNIYTIILLLILISLYDMWAVWHSGIMQKMAKYQIKQLKIFSGFFVPYMSKKDRAKIQKLKAKAKTKELKKKRIKVNVAILGGGDVIFPIITAGVMLKSFGFLPAILVILGATFGLGYLFFFAEKKKFYPAMPFITAGIFLGMGISWLIYAL